MIDFVKPLSAANERTALAFFDILNFVLRYCPTHPLEVNVMQRFAVGGQLSTERCPLADFIPYARRNPRSAP
jgi:hypothetical protein